MAGSADSLLVTLGSTSLVGENETSSNPDGTSTHHEGGSEKLAVIDTTGSDDLDGSTSDGRLVLVADLDTSGDEDGGGDITCVATTLTTLGADDVDTELEALLDVLDVANHVHVHDAMLVELVDNGLGGDTDGGNEELGTRFDDDVYELVELALGVIVAMRKSAIGRFLRNMRYHM